MKVGFRYHRTARAAFRHARALGVRPRKGIVSRLTGYGKKAIYVHDT